MEQNQHTEPDRRLTEATSRYHHLEQWDTLRILETMNAEDQLVAEAVRRQLTAIARLVEVIMLRLQDGGRLFYVGAGTSGRLGILDASECPPTFGVPAEMITGIIAGGDIAIRKAVEGAEDDRELAWKNLQDEGISKGDIVVGIAASGTTPYVLGGIAQCKAEGILTGCITCNPGSPLAEMVHYPIVVETGPEFVTGSTRLKAGTAQKMVLNMITTATMIRLGRVQDNKMVDMQLTNQKLVERGTRMVMEKTGLSLEAAHQALIQWGSVREAIARTYGPVNPSAEGVD